MSANAEHPNPLLDAALKYVSLGWSVIPLYSVHGGLCSCRNSNCQDQGKHPRVTWTPHQSRRATEGDVREWWRRWPDANIGVVTGAISGLIVLDVDGERGRETLASMGLEVPLTVCAMTGGGGWHHYLTHPGRDHRNTQSDVGPKIDTRGDGGYVVAPPSRHLSGTNYGWIEGCGPDEMQPALAPEWLLDIKGTDRDEGHRTGDSPVEKVPEGRRNAHLASFAGVMRRRGATYSVINAALQAENQERCHPPLAAEEASAVAASISQYPPGGPYDIEMACTDLGNAARMVAAYGDRLRYERAGGWYAWTGQRWERDVTLRVEAYAAECALGIYAEAALAEDADQRKELEGHARKSEARNRQEAMVESACHMLAVPPDVWDADPWLFNVENGTLDLRSGELREHRPGDHLTKLASVAYDAQSEAPSFERFLVQMVPDPDVRAFHQRSLGYALTGVIREQHLWFWYGVGSNGKGTLANLLAHVLGDYFLTAPPYLLERGTDRHPTELARLRGARLVMSVEIQEDWALNEARVKQLTGGDIISARYMRGDYFDFEPTHKLFLQGNHRPRIAGTDHAIWRRPLLVDFPVTIPNNEQDTELGDKLKAEAPGVLRWLVEGCLAWQEQGLQPPKTVQVATETYRQEQDLLGSFLDECCIIEPDAWVRSKDLYGAYGAWCEAGGEKPRTQRSLGNQLRERGFQRMDAQTKDKDRGWSGLRILVDVADTADPAAGESGLPL